MRTTLLVFSFIFFSAICNAQLYAGFRASRILSSYPNGQFPNEDYWSNTGHSIANKFPGSVPAAVWIVSLYNDNGIINMSFPSGGLSIPYVNFSSTDKNESYLTRFDTEGIKVWLQVEPGAANMDTIISIVLNRYKTHPCIAGFGIDVEWLNTQTYSGGQHVTDSMAQRWEQKVKAVDSNYSLFLKHYSTSRMPPVYRGSILFVDDSQDFPSLTSMRNEFVAWGNTFSPNPVAFQFGYTIDQAWWGLYADPMTTIGNELLSNISNCHGLFWVDFTINTLFPVNVLNNSSNNPIVRLENFPNPCTNETEINYYLPVSSHVLIKIIDAGGKEIKILDDENKTAGKYSVKLFTDGLTNGNYSICLEAGKVKVTKQFTIVKK